MCETPRLHWKSNLWHEIYSWRVYWSIDWMHLRTVSNFLCLFFICSFFFITKVYIFTSIILQGWISIRWKADWCKISARYLTLYLLTSTVEPSFGLQPVSSYNLMQSFHNKSCCSALKVWKTPNLSGCVLVKDVQNITVKLFNIKNKGGEVFALWIMKPPRAEKIHQIKVQHQSLQFLYRPPEAPAVSHSP